MKNHASLAARYRPQSFAEVTGQDTVKAILSLAAREDKVAPAYLLSGTRGVGKTTIARIFAKALNCEHAPTAEPCNQCEQCRRITAGNHVDVVEIDGASNRGIDDARRLREAVNYAPMQGRYKVFIIDEAHMLTRESFNALLKTLEEPPDHVTFILATTEAHKFPVTIVSRCQHFAFRPLPEADLAAHLTRVLEKEDVSFEENAVRLIARRAAGSVRDSMSLLGQTLALGGDSLTEEGARSVLGLAGLELYERLLTAFRNQDCLAVAGLTREMLDRGVDLGFFVRELALLWRNLFLIRQAGEQAADSLDLPAAERERLVRIAKDFDLPTIHAAWQMVLESQRQVLTSLEPAAALELLLINLALLPRLVGLAGLNGLPDPPAGGRPSAPSAAPLPGAANPSAAPQEAPDRPAVRPSDRSAAISGRPAGRSSDEAAPSRSAGAALPREGRTDWRAGQEAKSQPSAPATTPAAAAGPHFAHDGAPGSDSRSRPVQAEPAPPAPVTEAATNFQAPPAQSFQRTATGPARPDPSTEGRANPAPQPAQGRQPWSAGRKAPPPAASELRNRILEHSTMKALTGMLDAYLMDCYPVENTPLLPPKPSRKKKGGSNAQHE